MQVYGVSKIRVHIYAKNVLRGAQKSELQAQTISNQAC